MWLKFSSFGWEHDGWRNKEWKEPKLGDSPWHPKIIFKENQATKLGDAWASPLSSNDHRYFTWSYIFIRHISWVLLGASCMIWVFACFAFYFVTSILAGHTYLREPKLCYDLLELLFMIHLNVFSYGIALVLHLYLFEHGVL